MNKHFKNRFRKAKTLSECIFVFAIFSLFLAANILAAPADLDSSFGTGGKFIVNFPNSSSGESYAVLVQPDGKIILAGGANGQFNKDFTLVRLHATGTIDTSFGANGFVVTPIEQFSPEAVYALALQPDGKIIAAGNSSTPSVFTAQFAVVRYNPNGSLDTTFGSGGKAMTDFSTGVNDIIGGVVIQPDGKIVVAGTQNGKFALARLNANGSMDSSFGTAGKAVTQIVTDGNAFANVLLLQTDGKLVVAGSRTGPTSNINSAPVARFNTDGSLDTSFDGDGLAFPGLAFIRAGAIDSSGRLVFGGQGYWNFSASGFGLARLNPNGSADTSFNATGTSRLVIASPENENWVNGLAIQSNGKIVAAGRSYGNPNGYDFTLARFNENGSPENRFGNGGKMVTHIGAQQDWAYALSLQTDGKIVVAGASGARFAVARFMGGDVPRPHKFDFDGDGSDEAAVARTLQSSGLTWLMNNSQTGFKSVNWGLGTDKTATADYDGDGKTDLAVFRNGVWYALRSSNNSMLAFQFGTTGDIPVPADYDGDGDADFAVVRNNAQTEELTWYLYLTSNGQFSFQDFGASTDILVPADYNGDGLTEIAVYRPAEGRFYVSKGSRHNFDVIYWGAPGDKPVVADYDGDGKADAAVFRPSDGVWYINGSTGTNQFITWGLGDDKLVPADYDGDNKADAAVFRDGLWYIRQSSTSQMSVISFGQGGDQPVPGL